MASVDGMRDPLPSQINGEWPASFCEKWLENIAIKQETSPLSIQLFRTVEDGVLQHYPEYLLFEWTEGYHQELLDELAVFKKLVYGELAFKVFSEVTLEPQQEMRERQMGGLQAWCPVPRSALLCVLCIRFSLMLKNYFERDMPCLLQNINIAEIFQYFNTLFWIASKPFLNFKILWDHCITISYHNHCDWGRISGQSGTCLPVV